MAWTVLLWFVLGALASIAASAVIYDQISFNVPRIAASVAGALVGGIVMLIAVPNAWGWALLTALIGCAIALAFTVLYEIRLSQRIDVD